MQEMYDLIMKHKRAMADVQVMWEKAIREHQHEYDSDEEVDQRAGTWEHRLRKMEMEKTRGKDNHHKVILFLFSEVLSAVVNVVMGLSLAEKKGFLSPTFFQIGQNL